MWMIWVREGPMCRHLEFKLHIHLRQDPRCFRTWGILCTGLYSSMFLSPASGKAVNFLRVWCQSSDSTNVWVPPNSWIWGLHRMQGISEEAVLQTHPSSTLNLFQITFRQGVFVWIAKRSKIEKEFSKENSVSNICSSSEYTQFSHCWWLGSYFQTDKV